MLNDWLKFLARDYLSVWLKIMNSHTVLKCEQAAEPSIHAFECVVAGKDYELSGEIRVTRGYPLLSPLARKTWVELINLC